MEPGELQAAGQRAMKLLYEPNTPNTWAPLNRPSLGRNSSGSVAALDHNVSCDSCKSVSLFGRIPSQIIHTRHPSASLGHDFNVEPAPHRHLRNTTW